MKKILSIVVVFSLMLSLGTTAFASSNSNIDSLYDKYTIDFTAPTARTASNDESRISEAISFVKSLGLAGTEFSYIEEACLVELEAYRDSEVELNSYSVLVPKSDAAEKVFGTYNGTTFYYTTTSEAEYRKEVKKTLKDSDNDPDWNAWIIGAVNVGMCFASWKVSLPYTLVSNVLGAEAAYTVEKDTFMRYVYQVAPETRTVYKYVNGSKKIGVIDQKGTLDIKVNYCPVGLGFKKSDYLIRDLSNQKTEVNNYSNTDSVLKTAYTYSNRNAQWVDILEYYDFEQIWE